MNVVFKTTTHISIGDDIAFRGTKVLFDKALPGHNCMLYSSGEKDTWRYGVHVPVDLVVLAGTPVWTGKQMKGLEDFIIETSTPTFYCGVGMNYHKSDRTSAALANAIGFVARDRFALKRAQQDIDAELICCPSIFSADPMPRLDDKIGLVLQVDTFVEEQIEFINRFSKYEVILICNEMIDFIWAQSNFPEYRSVYSRTVSDMINFYRHCRAIYSLRIHGAHLAYALGIPTVCLKNRKDKSVTCKYIGLNLVSPLEATEDDLACDQSLKPQRREAFDAAIARAMAQFAEKRA